MILLEQSNRGAEWYVTKTNSSVICRNSVVFARWIIRIYGSHSEAKRELEKWLPEWPDAKIVDEVDL